MSIIRATPAQRSRRLIVLLSVVFAIVVALAQMFMGWGQSQAEFAADSDATLAVAPWAFAIWGLIYAALLVYAVRQALPQTGESDMINRFGWPSVLAFLSIGFWIVAAAFDQEVATIVLIFGSLIVLLVPILMFSGLIRSLGKGDRDRWMTAWPLGLLAGWLTIAAPVNLLTVATGNGDLPTGLAPIGWALIAVAVVVIVALAVTWRTRLLAYPLPIAWGLVGVFAAEQSRNPTLAFSALGAALIVLIGGLVLALNLRPNIGVARA